VLNDAGGERTLVVVDGDRLDNKGKKCVELGKCVCVLNDAGGERMLVIVDGDRLDDEGEGCTELGRRVGVKGTTPRETVGCNAGMP
jgi:hypothetical protein